MKSWTRAVPIVFVVAIVAGGCLRKTDHELPSEPNAPESPPTAPSLSPIAPVPIGPAPAPTPIPQPGVSPTPQASPPPSSAACRLPPGTGSGENCPRISPVFLGDVQDAINQLIQAQPTLFVKQACEGCYVVTDPDAYISGVVQQLSRRGLCATYDGEELAVKNSNDFSEQYDILSAGNAVRSGGESYRATCKPAWF
jgi:hypothetical protein